MFQSIFKPQEQDSELNIYRLLMLAGAIGMPVFGLLQMNLDGIANESMLIRYGVSLTCCVALGLSFIKFIPRDSRMLIIEMVLYLYTAISIFVNYQNYFGVYHQLGQVLTVTAISVAFRTQKRVLLYFSFFMVLIILALISAPIPATDKTLYVTSYIIISIILSVASIIRLQAQSRLMVSEQFLRSVLNQSVDAIFLVNKIGEIVDGNQRLAELFETSTENLKNRNINEFLVNPYSKEDRDEIIKAVNDGEGWRKQIQCKTANGRAFWVDTSITLINKYSNAFSLVRLTDIDNLKRIERDLLASQERFALSVDGANDGLWDWDFITNEVYFSDRYIEMLGYDKSEFQYDFENWKKRVLPEDLPKAIKDLDNYLDGTTNSYRTEFRMRHKKGHHVWILARGKAIKDEKGNWVRMAGSHSDITERKKYEMTLQGVMNSSLNGIMAFKSIRKQGQIVDFECLHANHSSIHALKRNKEEVIGESLLKLLPGLRISGLFQHFTDVAETGKSLKIEHHYDHDELSGWFQVMAVKMGDGFVATFENISARKQAEEELVQAKEQAEQGARAKSEFLATMSHEIRTPMNAVIGMTGLLLETKLTDNQRDYAETIRISGDNLLAIINDILDYSKIDSGKLELENRPFDLVDCIEDVINLLSQKAWDKGLEMIYYLRPGVPRNLKGDDTRIRQILINLINNALKFTAKGEIFLSVRAINITPEKAVLEFAIKDTGIGIPEDKINTLFRSFSQVDSSTTRRFGGTGLGLAITKKLVEMMHGTIWVESKLNQGSKFYFTLQLDTDAEKSIGAIGAAQQDNLAGKHALIVDDNLTNLKILELQCKSWGMVVSAFAKPQDALTALKIGKKFDVAVLDMQMPDMDGKELSQKIRNQYDASQLPIIILTSLGHDAEFNNNGLYSSYIVKPIKQAHLFLNINKVLNTEGAHIRLEKIKEPKRKPTNFRTNVRILLAEDNLINQRVTTGIMENLGFDIDIAANGTEAVEMAQRYYYDLVLMDVQMPEMDGLEATQALRKLDGFKQPIIIAMTANAMKEDKDKCLEAGMDDYISKPVKIDTLRGIMNQWFPLN